MLLTGCEVSLWVAEQFASDLKMLFPGLRVQVTSSNKVISVLGNARGKLPPTGSPFCRTSHAMDNTVCIAISQSGQTFPTIHATRILNMLLPGRVWVMCGAVDTNMSLALGQRVALGAPLTRRIFTTCAGSRCAEPPSMVVVAMHHNLTELLNFIIVRFRTGPLGCMPKKKPLGLSLHVADMVDLRAVRDRFIDATVPLLTGYIARRERRPSPMYDKLVAQGRHWALHIIESPTAWVLSLCHIIGTVVSGWPAVYAIMHGACLGLKCSYTTDKAVS